MKRLLTFKTKLGKDEIVKIFRDNTFAIEKDFQSIPSGKQYFSGQVTTDRIRLKNALRRSKNPSTILEVFLNVTGTDTEVIVEEEAGEEGALTRQTMLAITIPLGIVVLFVGGILSLINPEEYSILWTLIIVVGISGVGLIDPLLYNLRVRSNTEADLSFIVRLIQK